MITILLSWIFITLLAYCTGAAIHAALLKITGKGDDLLSHFSICCITGLLAIDFLSTLYCLFLPLDIFSNLFILAVALILTVAARRQIRSLIGQHLSQLKTTGWIVILIFISFILLTAYQSYMPSSHYDDGLYYSTSIKWLQEYGTVPGIANINTRIGFNSSWLILQAAFGFRLLNAGLFNDLNGLLYLYALLFSLGGMRRLYKGDRSISNALRALFFLPVLAFHFGATSEIILFNVNFLESPTADLPVALLISIIFILYLDAAEKNTIHGPRQWILFLYIVMLITMKLSVAPILFIPLTIAFSLIRQRKWGTTFALVAASIMLITPWLARNVMVSGYLVFPFAALDIFNVDWKLPIYFPRYHEYAVMAWATDPSFPENRSFLLHIDEWFPGWFQNLRAIDLFSFFAIIIQTIVLLAITLRRTAKANWAWFRSNRHAIIFAFTAIAGILFWFFKGPDFRFGYGFISIYLLFGLALLLRAILMNRFFLTGYFALFSCVLIILTHYRDSFSYMIKDLGKAPLPFRMPETPPTIINRGGINFTITGEQSWNAPLPAAMEREFKAVNPIPRGKSIKNGFRPYESINQTKQ